MWVTYDLIRMNFTTKNLNFMFSEVFPIVNPMVNGIGSHYPKLRAINYFFLYMGSLYIETAEIYW